MLPLKDNVPTRRFPIVTVTLIAVNVCVFFLLEHARIGLGGAEIDQTKVLAWGVIPFRLSHPGSVCGLLGEAIACGPNGGLGVSSQTQAPAVVTVVSAMFMHGGLLHLAGNMLFLWIFGNNVEDSMGRVRFICFYLVGGVVALVAQVAVDPNSTAPTIGASGAIAAVLGGYAVLYPRARVVTLVFIIFFVTLIELPALLVLGLWLCLQLLSGSAELTQAASQGGVAYFAHIGGFIFGLALIKLFANHRQDDYAIRKRLPVY